MRVKDAVGRFGEDVACRYLQDRGFVILDRNWRCPDGELDIVAVDQADASGPCVPVEGESVRGPRRGELVVVEVKTRSSAYFGSPAEAVGRAKAARLRRLTARWIEEHPTCRDWQDVRIDVIAVVRSSDQSDPVQVDHFVSAV